MVGMIWTIQIVHYPLFAFVGSETYEDFQAKHVEVIGVLLVVPWLSRDYLLLFSWSACRAAFRDASGRWCSPYGFDHGSQRFRSAPAHGDLASGFNVEVHNDLMFGNLIRSILWTARVVSLRPFFGSL